MEMVDDGMMMLLSFSIRIQSKAVGLIQRTESTRCHTQVKGVTTINPPTEVACLRRMDTHNQDSELEITLSAYRAE